MPLPPGKSPAGMKPAGLAYCRAVSSTDDDFRPHISPPGLGSGVSSSARYSAITWKCTVSVRTRLRDVLSHRRYVVVWSTTRIVRELDGRRLYARAQSLPARGCFRGPQARRAQYRDWSNKIIRPAQVADSCCLVDNGSGRVRAAGKVRASLKGVVDCLPDDLAVLDDV
jgi:hypothetical protein